jgi:group II intron reverse transcriptase/maturase
VLDGDIRSFFDNLSPEWLVRFLQHRVADPRILRLIQKWLRAGVSEDGQWSETQVGVPQGAVASPLLANVSLHYVLDLWVEAWRKKVAQGNVVVVRYADDSVVGFEYRNDAERFLAELRARLRQFGLEVHPDKTRLIEFGPHAISRRKQRGEGKPETFDFLGFTHICERHPKTGYFIVRRKTARKRMVAKLKSIHQQLRQRRHEPVAQTGQWLGSVVQGSFNYHAVPGNMRTLGTFRRRVIRLWRRQLRLRSQKSRMNWRRLGGLIQRWIPTQRILHPFPSVRFDATHPR